MKNLLKYLFLSATIFFAGSCDNDDVPASNNMNLAFNNTFKNTPIVLGGANAASATSNTSAENQVHHFSELKYVVSNIRLIMADGTEFPYNVNDLDIGAAIIDHSKPATMNYVLSNIPSGEYKQIKFGLGVKNELNTLDQTRFPNFYAAAGANDTEMMWDWGIGHRFTKIEGFYDTDNKELSIHTGSTLESTKDDQTTYTQGVDAYREIVLDLSTNAVVGRNVPTVNINADFDKLLSGNEKIKLLSGTGMMSNATPSIHHAGHMEKFVNNLGGNGESDLHGMFTVNRVEN